MDVYTYLWTFVADARSPYLNEPHFVKLVAVSFYIGATSRCDYHKCISTFWI